MNTKPILAYDCACLGATVALSVGGKVVSRTLSQTEQASQLVPVIDGLLREHKLSYGDLGAIVSTVGPGSFTGVRIGLAALHGFVLVSGVAVKLISTLEAVAWIVAATSPAKFYVTLRAGKGEVYAQLFEVRDGAPLPAGEIFLAPEDKQDWDAQCYGDLLPDAAVMCAVAEQLPAAHLADAVPLYIRAPDAVVGQPHAWLKTN